jgi:ABC-2 type transport system ATP-binding protein
LLKQVFHGFAQRGRSVFLSTHSLTTAEEVCDRVGILSKGKLIALGTVEELRKQTHSSGDLESVFLKLTQEEVDQPADEAARAHKLLDAVLGPPGKQP